MYDNIRDNPNNYSAMAIISFLESSLETGLDDLAFIKDVLHIVNNLLSEE